MLCPQVYLAVAAWTLGALAVLAISGLSVYFTLSSAISLILALILSLLVLS